MDAPGMSSASNDAPQATHFPYENVPIPKLRATLEEAGASMKVRARMSLLTLPETGAIAFI
jgi:hypothetical protein